MAKRIVAFALSIAMLLSLSSSALAHSKEGVNGHDQFMSMVLFGDKADRDSDALEALEDAVAICIDQYNGCYAEELSSLNAMDIHGLPKDISAINFQGNQHHRRYTHMGWNFEYVDDKGNWQLRKTILLQTVNKVFGFRKRAGEWKTGPFSKNHGYDRQCEAFAELLYYIHILADIDGSNMDEGYSDMIKLALAHPTDKSPDIYAELLRILPILFESQKSKASYTGLITDIKSQANTARSFIKDNPHLKENYDQYKEYAEKLLEKLRSKIPNLLANEPFFSAVFP